MIWGSLVSTDSAEVSELQSDSDAMTIDMLLLLWWVLWLVLFYTMATIVVMAAFKLWQLICVVFVGFIRPHLLPLHSFSGGVKTIHNGQMKRDPTHHQMTHVVLS